MPRKQFTTPDIQAELRRHGVEPAFDVYRNPSEPLPFLCSCPEQRPGTITFRALHYQGVRPLCPVCRRAAQADRMRANRRAPTPPAAPPEILPRDTVHGMVAQRAAAILAGQGAQLLDAYVGQDTPLRFVCPGPCGGAVHRITWAALRAGRVARCPSCRAADRPSGAAHHRYDPDRPEAERAQDRTAADRRWERAVRHAHGGLCVITGHRGTAPHHLYGYDIHPELRLLLQNGILLTHRLHREFHEAYRFGGNTYAQFVAFYEVVTGHACPIPDPLDLSPAVRCFVS